MGSARAYKDTVTIVTHKAGDKVVNTKKVPRNWKEHADLAADVRTELGKQYANREDIGYLSLAPSNNKFGERWGFRVEIEASSQSARNVIPDEVNGIPVKAVEPEERVLEGNACYNEKVYDDTPGGVTFDGATAGSQYYIDYDGDGSFEQTMLTAGHVISFNHCDTNIVGNNVTQHHEDWGEVVDHRSSLDVAACAPTQYGKSVDNHIQQTFDKLVVSGHVTESGLQDMVANEEYVWKTGIMTGTTSGKVDKMYEGGSGCGGYNNEGVRSKNDSSSGDSGCPVYDVRGDEAYMIYVHNQGGETTTGDTDCEGQEITAYSHGASAYEIIDEFGGAFVDPGNVTK